MINLSLTCRRLATLAATTVVVAGVATVPAQAKTWHKCLKNRFCVYEKGGLRGSSTGGLLIRDCMKTPGVKKNRSVDNHTSHVAYVYKNANCTGRSLKVQPDSKFTDLSGIGYFKSWRKG